MKSNKTIEKNGLILVILPLSAIITFLFVLLYFYLTKSQEIIEGYTTSFYSKYLILNTIILIVKIIISGYLTEFFFQKWLKKNERHFIDITFLLGLFFYLYIYGKIIDFVIFLSYFNNEIIPINIIDLIRMRYIYGMFVVMPLYLLGLYLYLYKKNLYKPYSEIKKIFKKFSFTFLTIYLSIWIITLYFLNNPYFIRLIIIALGILIFLISWIFFKAYRGKILPDINCLIISIGFCLYAISQISFPFLAFLLNLLIIDAEVISNLIMEVFSLISFIIVLTGFKKKAKY